MWCVPPIESMFKLPLLKVPLEDTPWECPFGRFLLRFHEWQSQVHTCPLGSSLKTEKMTGSGQRTTAWVIQLSPSDISMVQSQAIEKGWGIKQGSWGVTLCSVSGSPERATIWAKDNATQLWLGKTCLPSERTSNFWGISNLHFLKEWHFQQYTFHSQEPSVDLWVFPSHLSVGVPTIKELFLLCSWWQ